MQISPSSCKQLFLPLHNSMDPIDKVLVPARLFEPSLQVAFWCFIWSTISSSPSSQSQLPSATRILSTQRIFPQPHSIWEAVHSERNNLRKRLNRWEWISIFSSSIFYNDKIQAHLRHFHRRTAPYHLGTSSGWCISCHLCMGMILLGMLKCKIQLIPNSLILFLCYLIQCQCYHSTIAWWLKLFPLLLF